MHGLLQVILNLWSWQSWWRFIRIRTIPPVALRLLMAFVVLYSSIGSIASRVLRLRIIMEEQRHTKLVTG